MFKYLLFVLGFLVININCVSVHAADEYEGYTKYNPKWADVYIGVGYVSLADISTYSAGNPVWGALYNPMKLLNNYGFNFNVGIRPLEIVPLLRNFRIEGEWQYRESRYKTLIDSKKATWVNKSKLPPYGKLYLKGVAMLNGYYDFRMISNNFYPYIGAGLGVGNLGIRHIDFTLLPSGIGEEYMGYKANVPIVQFMGGFQYDTKILKTSVFVEYRFASSNKITAYPTYNGYEKQKKDDDGKDQDKPKPTIANYPTPLDKENDNDDDDKIPDGYVPPAPKQIGYKAHAIMFGVKYYLY